MDGILIPTILCELGAAAAVLFSIRFPLRRIWPPDRPRAWKMILMGFLFFASSIGIGLLGLLEWGGMGFPEWVRIGLGLPPLVGGWAFFLWAQGILGFGQMMGNAGALMIRGPFRFSRNPQYLGCLIMLAGWVLFSSAPSAAIVSLVAVIPLVLVPFSEEPWLRERYGSAYDDYCRKVRRFF